MERESIIEIVEEILEEKLGDYFANYLAGREREYERIGVMERLIRLEEELKAQRELMEVRFEAVDKRFEDMNRRFTMLTWLIFSLFGALALLITVFKFVG